MIITNYSMLNMRLHKLNDLVSEISGHLEPETQAEAELLQYMIGGLEMEIAEVSEKIEVMMSDRIKKVFDF